MRESRERERVEVEGWTKTAREKKRNIEEWVSEISALACVREKEMVHRGREAEQRIILSTTHMRDRILRRR